MDNVKLDSQYTLEIVRQIVEYVNKIDDNVEMLKDKVSSIDSNQIWNSQSAVELKNRSSNLCENFSKECVDFKQMISKLIQNIEKYQEIDKKVIESICGTMNI